MSKGKKIKEKEQDTEESTLRSRNNSIDDDRAGVCSKHPEWSDVR